MFLVFGFYVSLFLTCYSRVSEGSGLTGSRGVSGPSNAFDLRRGKGAMR